MRSGDNKKKLKGEIIAVIVVCSVILAIAATFIIQYAVRVYKEEKAAEQIARDFEQRLVDNKEKADEIKESVNTELAGVYISKGEITSDNTAEEIAVMQFMPDGTLVARRFVESEATGWWASSQKSGVEYVAVGISDNEAISMYQVSDSYLIDMRSVYTGKIKKNTLLDTELVCESPTGKMVLNLDSTGKATGEFTDTNENSQNNGLKYMLSGAYTPEGDFVTVVLNGASTRFLVFDHGIEDTDMDSGIASVYFERE